MKKVLRTFVFISFGILALLAIACGIDSAPQVSGTAESYDGPTLRESIKDAAIRAVMKNREISNVTIGQDGSEISVLVVVDCGTSERAAKRFGRKIVHMIKLLSPDTKPQSQSELGTGV